MNRLTTSLLLVALAGVGWACAFAVVGLGAFAGRPDNHLAGIVFAAFGFAAGAACAALRLAFEHQLPMDLAASLRRTAEPSDATSAEPASSATASAFGA
ncbi:MAG: hypothetical protein HY855_18340 [Burkholderiales bacterium]|nr:hypothetical protein [Burkholderiales bacterium]